MNTIVTRLNAKKKELGLTNKELSIMSGVPYSTICRVLANRGDGTPNLQTLKDLAKALDVSLDGVVGLENEPEDEENAEGAVFAESEGAAPTEDKVDPGVISLITHNYESLLEERQKLLESKEQTIKFMERWMLRLFAACCILVAVIVGVLIFDLVSPSVGFFQR